MSGNEEKGFKIVDRRASSQEVEKESKPEGSSAQQEPEKKTPENANKESQKIPVPEANFLHLLLTFYTEAQRGLGIVPHPLTKKIEKDMAQAKYMIDVLGLLKDKTKGNLTPEEDRALADMLFDLRMTYVEEMKK
jgi:hypothetical protein